MSRSVEYVRAAAGDQDEAQTGAEGGEGGELGRGGVGNDGGQGAAGVLPDRLDGKGEAIDTPDVGGDQGQVLEHGRPPPLAAGPGPAHPGPVDLHVEAAGGDE